MPKSLYSSFASSDIPSWDNLLEPLQSVLPAVPLFKTKGNKPVEVSFEDMLKSLIFFHLEEHSSGRHLLQVLEEDDFARSQVAPEEGLKRSTFFEVLNSRYLEQFMYVFQALSEKSVQIIPNEFAADESCSNLIAIDGSFIDGVLSMDWADYRNNSKKAKVHIGFDINRSIPRKIFLSDGKADERFFANQMLSKDQTAVMDRYHQHHKNFDLSQEDEKLFVCRIKDNTTQKIIQENPSSKESTIFYDAIVLLGKDYSAFAHF